MNLRHAGDTPDWENVPTDQWNSWQQLAAITSGVITPANIVSLCGALAVVWGLAQILEREFLTGLILIGSGRLVDAFDGAIAELTGTKSQVGAAVDAGLDKIVALLALGVLMVTAIIPLWLAILIVAQNVMNLIISWYSAARDTILLPSRAGKWSTTAYWISLLFFVFAAAASAHSLLLLAVAYVLGGTGLTLGARATYGYYRTARAARIHKAIAEAMFDRYVVLYNPASSEAHRSEERIATLRRLQPNGDFHILRTVPGGKEPNEQLIREHASLLGPKTLLCIAAGDGTVSLVLQTLLHDKQLPAYARRTPILPLWCGNANDLAYMLNGNYSRRRLRHILLRGQVMAIKSLECRLTSPDGSTQTFTAACYASFGATAYATQELERAIPRGSPTRRFAASRFGQEFFAALLALAKSPTFTVVEHGRRHSLYERTYLNGSRFAKIFGIPLKLTDEKFHRNSVEQKHPLKLLLAILGLMNRREVSRRAITHDHFEVIDEVWAQFDGDAVRLTAGTKITIGISSKPFYALSVRLKP